MERPVARCGAVCALVRVCRWVLSGADEKSKTRNSGTAPVAVVAWRVGAPRGLAVRRRRWSEAAHDMWRNKLL